jgi:AraC-like DNA-binding protein
LSTSQEYLLVIGSFQGCLLFILLLFDTRLNTASRVLGVLCLLMASVLLMPFLLLAEPGPLQRVVGWLFYLPAAAGALAYLYCRSALLGQPLRHTDAWLFLPWFSCYLLTLDFLVGDPQRMIAWVNGARATTWRLQASEYLIFAQAFAYAGVTMSMIWRYRRQAGDTLADFNPAVFRWLLLLQVFTLVIWVLKALPALTSASVVFAHAANLLMVILIYLIAITQWRNPQLFSVPQLSEEQAADAAPTGSDDRPAADGEFDPTTRAKLFEVIRAAVEGRQLYLDSQLTLSGLAEATRLSRHQVSEVLNRHAGKNFYEFINEYRIAAVCERLGSEGGETVLSIAMDAGFSSKSTFNVIFKQFTGMTPTAYRRQRRPSRV